jgi:hypothetical protein
MPLYPFLAALAGPGIVDLWKTAESRWAVSKKTAQGAIALLVFIQVAWMAWMHPHYLSDYNPIAGGLPGAHRLGLETTYWCDSIDPKVIEFVNEKAPEGAQIGILPYPELVTIAHRDLGTFREDLKLVDARKQSSDWIILMYRRGMFGDRERKLSELASPVFERRKFGVTLSQVFDETR